MPPTSSVVKTMEELVVGAPRVLNESVLGYLNTGWEDNEKKHLPKSLNPKDDFVGTQERLFRLRYLINYWEIGPETKFEDVWVKRAMLSFSGDELKRGITRLADWGGLTDVLRATIALCKGVSKVFNHKLWMEHNVSKMADTLSCDDTLGVNFGELDDNLSYDHAPDCVKMRLLELVDCRLKQKKS